MKHGVGEKSIPRNTNAKFLLGVTQAAGWNVNFCPGQQSADNEISSWSISIFFFIFVWECICFSVSNIHLMHCVSQQYKLPGFPNIECFIISCSRGFSGTQRSSGNTPLGVVSYKYIGWSGAKSSFFWSQDSLPM